MKPTLDGLVRGLQVYAAQVSDPTEAAMLAEYVPFITTHSDCLWRTCRPGHLTASAWIVDAARQRTLLTHHRKLDRWLQLGGHVDGEADLQAAALREAREESGLTLIKSVGTAILDVDRHRIPARGDEPEHWHFDVRYLFEADPDEPLQLSDESKDLAWVALAEVSRLNPSESLARMVRKTRR